MCVNRRHPPGRIRPGLGERLQIDFKVLVNVAAGHRNLVVHGYTSAHLPLSPRLAPYPVCSDQFGDITKKFGQMLFGNKQPKKK